MIKNLKNKMYQYIEKYGLTSNKTVNASQQLDKELNKYYSENSSMIYFYKQSIDGLLKYYNIHASFPSITEWNSYAKKENYLSHESIQYICGKKFDSWCIEIVNR